jgi:prevent-host-death family protein
MAQEAFLDRIVDVSEFKRRPARYLREVARGRPLTIRQRGKGEFVVLRREDAARMSSRIRELEDALEVAELLLDPKVRSRLEQGLPERGIPLEEATRALGLPKTP